MIPKTYMMEICPNVKSNAIYAANLMKEILNISHCKACLIFPKSAELETVVGLELMKELRENNLIKIYKLPNLFFSLGVIILILKLRPKIIHLQHEYAWYNRSLTFIPLIFFSKLLGLRVAVTMHSVFRKPKVFSKKVSRKTALEILKQNVIRHYVELINRIILKKSDVIIVHTLQMMDVIKTFPYSRKNIVVIPHGSDTKCSGHFKCNDSTLNDSLCIRTLGYIEERKGQDISIQIMKRLNEIGINAHLHIEGDIPYSRANRKNYEFYNYIVELSKNMENVSIETRYFTNDEFRTKILSSDIILLPYRRENREQILSTNASGIFSTAIGCGVTVVGSNVPAFISTISMKCSKLTFTTIEEAVDIISSFAKDRSRLKLVSSCLKKIAEENISWEKIASLHWDVFSKL